MSSTMSRVVHLEIQAEQPPRAIAFHTLCWAGASGRPIRRALVGSVALETMAIRGIGWLADARVTEGDIFGMMQRDPTAA
jgi:predicted enzyme related to lactoylglutathione lyase